MTTITLTPDQVASVVAQASGKPAESPVAPPSVDMPVKATWAAFGHDKFESDRYAAGSGFSIAINVSDSEKFVAVIGFTNVGTPAFKHVVISDAPGKMDGIIIGGKAGLNAADIAIGCNYPEYGLNLTPGTHYINILLLDEGSVKAEKTTQ